MENNEKKIYTFSDVKVKQVYRLKDVRNLPFKKSSPYIKVVRIYHEHEMVLAHDARPPIYKKDKSGIIWKHDDPACIQGWYMAEDFELEPLLNEETGIIMFHGLPVFAPTRNQFPLY